MRLFVTVITTSASVSMIHCHAPQLSLLVQATQSRAAQWSLSSFDHRERRPRDCSSRQTQDASRARGDHRPGKGRRAGTAVRAMHCGSNGGPYHNITFCAIQLIGQKAVTSRERFGFVAYPIGEGDGLLVYIQLFECESHARKKRGEEKVVSRPRRNCSRFRSQPRRTDTSLFYSLLSLTLLSFFGLRPKNGGDRIRTCDLEVMSLASYRAAPPRVIF